MRSLFFTLPLTFAINAFSADEAPPLFGLHWYGPSEAINEGAATPANELTEGRSVWVLEHLLTDPDPLGNHFDHIAQKEAHLRRVASEGHSLIIRLQPNWGRNIPHPDDPYTLDDFVRDTRTAAERLRGVAHIWQIGNEVNLRSENNHWDGSNYTISWQPSPQDYALVYTAIRNAIHEVHQEGDPLPIVLMQPVSPGNAGNPSDRFLDGNEFLHQQIMAMGNPALIDGFAVHSYADPGAVDFGVAGFMGTLREQLMIITGNRQGGKPVFLTEFNKHMPDDEQARNGARFLSAAIEALADYNQGTGDLWPGRRNHPVTGALWFVHPKAEGDLSAPWNEYSLEFWRERLSENAEENPWYSAREVLRQAVPSGAFGGGQGPDPVEIWIKKDREGINPAIRLYNSDHAEIRSRWFIDHHVYTDSRLYATLRIVSAERRRPEIGEANTELRIRQGARGYSLTFYPETSERHTNMVELRVTGQWTQVGSYISEVAGGIREGDAFKIDWHAEGRLHRIRITRDGETAPFIMWEVSDDEPINVGRIGAASYNLMESHVENLVLGGPRMVIDF